jgi:hypothetical protein
MLFEEPALRLSGDKWGRGPKRQMKARVRTFVMGTCHSQSYEFGRNKMGILKIMTNQ